MAKLPTPLGALLSEIGGGDGGWRQEAACSQVHNPNIFFPFTERQEKWAKAYCQVCPVAQQCAAEGAAMSEGMINNTDRSGRGYTTLWGLMVGVRAGEQTAQYPTHTKVYWPVKISNIGDPLYIRYDPPPAKPRGCVCEWCNREYKSLASTQWLAIHGMFCSQSCARQSREFTIRDTNGDHHRMCGECYKVFPVNELTTAPPSHRAKGYYCARCINIQADKARRRLKRREWDRLYQKWGDPNTGMLNRPCNKCGTEFQASTPRNRTCLRCTKKGYRKPGVYTHRCPCGKVTEDVTWIKQSRKYCSRECSNRTQSERLKKYADLVCKNCGKTEKNVWGYRTRNEFCSIRCAVGYRHIKKRAEYALLSDRPIADRCRQCDKPLPADVPNERKLMRRYCSKACNNHAKRNRHCAACLELIPSAVTKERETHPKSKVFFCDKPECEKVRDTEYIPTQGKQDPNRYVTRNVTCKTCRQVFEATWNRWKKPLGQQYCSNACKWEGQSNPQRRPPLCTVCGDRMVGTPSRHYTLHTTGLAECDCRCRSCFVQPDPDFTPVKCEYPPCGTTFVPHFTGRNRRIQRFCKRECFSKNKAYRPVAATKLCENGCGTTLEITRWLPPYEKMSPGQADPEPSSRANTRYKEPRYCPPCSRVAAGRKIAAKAQAKKAAADRG